MFLNKYDRALNVIKNQQIHSNLYVTIAHENSSKMNSIVLYPNATDRFHSIEFGLCVLFVFRARVPQFPIFHAKIRYVFIFVAVHSLRRPFAFLFSILCVSLCVRRPSSLFKHVEHHLA